MNQSELFKHGEAAWLLVKNGIQWLDKSSAFKESCKLNEEAGDETVLLRIAIGSGLRSSCPTHLRNECELDIWSPKLAPTEVPAF